MATFHQLWSDLSYGLWLIAQLRHDAGSQLYSLYVKQWERNGSVMSHSALSVVAATALVSPVSHYGDDTMRMYSV